MWPNNFLERNAVTRSSTEQLAEIASLEQLREQLIDILGSERVLADKQDLEFYSSDIFGGDRIASLVIRPDTTASLADATGAITSSGYAVIGRGGGTSYTGGYVPERSTSVVVDTSDLKRIVEINQDDMYVTVEAGVTWQQLYEALKDLDVRTPFWGPLSGSLATVGGALSQNSILWGSTSHDVSAASVLSLEVVLADGSVLNTGSAATGAKPFFRNYGPDLTGPFLGDCGALGIKSRATLRLMRRPSEFRLASFNFDQREKLSRAMVSISQEGLAASCFAMDPMLQYQRIKRASMGQGVKALKGVLSAGKTTFSGIRDAMRIAVAGKRFLDDNGYSLHVVIETADKASADASLAHLVKLCTGEGTKIENTVPTMMYSNPFVDMTSSIGPAGERWAPMHGLFPLSDADAAWQSIEALFDEYMESFDRLGIMVGYLLALVSSTVFVIEPVLYWPGPRTVWHQRVLDADQQKKLTEFPDNAEVNATVKEVRDRLNHLFADLGASHLQIGKKYRYHENLQLPARTLLEAIKTAVDPKGLMNPTALGLTESDTNRRSPLAGDQEGPKLT